MEEMWLFVGPTPLSGIGQVMLKYSKMIPNSEYITFDKTPTKKFTRTFAFIIPQRSIFEQIMQKFNPDIIMTVCETEPVHEDYRLIFESGKQIVVPSQFCKDIFQKQFPWAKMEIFPHWAGEMSKESLGKESALGPYTFYTIGNALDRRKNVDELVNTFLSCKFGNRARLVIKATCIEPVTIQIPGVLVLNGLVSDEHMERIHASCDCYINFSKSEGVGMGAVEAAVRNKPVIITNFGGLKEYVKTPFVVECSEECVGVYDFLYEPHMKWGKPSVDDLMRHMKYCFENNIRTWDHSHTREFTSRSVLCAKLSEFGRFALTGSAIDVPSATDGDRNGSGDTSGSTGDLILI